MKTRLPVLVASGLLAFVATGCSSGSTTGDSSVRIRCNDGSAFCLVSCDLGCTSTTCSITEIAENQRLRFSFSEAVDPASVNNATLSIRTATGVAPDGSFSVNGSEVVFVPSVHTSGGVSTFGFARNESYVITLVGGTSPGQTVRSTSGARLSRELSCTVLVSRGIIDEDGQPPVAELVAPTQLVDAPNDPTIVLRFSELIDTTPLQGSLSGATPVRVVLRSTRIESGERVCAGDEDGTPLTGQPQLSTESVGGHEVTVVTFQPTILLPGHSCITVSVTADLRDLSGRQATPAEFVFLTQQGVSVPIDVNENFTSNAGLNLAQSSGTWQGGARPGLIGGDGRHGSFDVSLGLPLGNSNYEWNTDSFTIPAANSLNGTQYQVTDGKFYFTDFVLPESATLTFTGHVPPQIWVRGTCEVRGKILLNGKSTPFGVPTSGPAANQPVSTFDGRQSTTNAPGETGADGGPGGGKGGNGGKELNLTTTPTGPEIVAGVNLNNGRDGETVQVGAGHAYAGSAGGTGGHGGPLHPAAGGTASTPVYLLYRTTCAIGGGGGGFQGAGSTATYTAPAASTLSASAPGAAGAAFAILPYPANPPSGYSSLLHFLVGGSGGGGGGSHPFLTSTQFATNLAYCAGGGGTGGGGALALRAGGDVVFGPLAVVQAKGGTGVLYTGYPPTITSPNLTNGLSIGPASPGGGGSGGSILVQSGGDISFGGTVDVSGGAGGRISNLVTPLPTNVLTTLQSGNGAPGYYRFEADGAVAFSGTGTPAYVPATNSGGLNDRDPISVSLSTWRGTGLLFPPTWEYYELDVDTDGNGTIDITYTDTGASGTQIANDPAGPVRIEFQAANVDLTTLQPIEGSIRPWREAVGSAIAPGISLDSRNGLRFQLYFNRDLFPNCIVRALRVHGRT